MQIKKTIIKICAFLFILPSLLLPNLSFDSNRAIAQASRPIQAEPLSSDSDLPLDFYQHLVYKPYSPGRETRIVWQADIDFQQIFIPRAIRRTKDICKDTEQVLCQKWIFRTEQRKNTRSDWFVTDEFIQSIPCHLQGNVQVSAGEASFNPDTQDHLECKLPSFKDVANQMAALRNYKSRQSGLQIAVKDFCPDCIDPWGAADIEILSTGQNNYPVFYLQADQNILAGYKPIFKSEIKARNRNIGSFNTYISAWDSPEDGESFSLNQPQTMWSGMNPKHFVNILSQRNARHPNLWTQFWADETTLIPFVNARNIRPQAWLSWRENQVSIQPVSRETQEYELSTGPMTLYIGYNPETQNHFSGTMYNVGVDPACVGH